MLHCTPVQDDTISSEAIYMQKNPSACPVTLKNPHSYSYEDVLASQYCILRNHGKAITCNQSNHMQPIQPHAAKATTCNRGNHIHPKQLHAAKATTWCSEGDHMHSSQPHAAKPTTCSPGNHMQPTQPHAAKVTTCSQGNYLRPR